MCRPRRRTQPICRHCRGSNGTATTPLAARRLISGAKAIPPPAATIASSACWLRSSMRAMSGTSSVAACSSTIARRPWPGIESNRPGSASARPIGTAGRPASAWPPGTASSTSSSSSGCTSSRESASGSTTMAKSTSSASTRAIPSSVPSISTRSRAFG